MADHSQMKLGRKAIKTDTRTLRLARYMGASDTLPVAPAAVDWTRGIKDWGMMLNDSLGDCTIAGCAHAVQVWTANMGSMATVADADILKAYEAWDGYNPADPSTDAGGIELDVLNDWRKSGLAGHTLAAFADVSSSLLPVVRQAINLFGGVYIGISLPLSAQTQDVWDPTGSLTESAPGSWGGHCVFVPKYDAAGFTCITWGQLKTMTTAFWNTYVDEVHALLSPDWLGTMGSPEGFNLTALQADLLAIQ